MEGPWVFLGWLLRGLKFVEVVEVGRGLVSRLFAFLEGDAALRKGGLSAAVGLISRISPSFNYRIQFIYSSRSIFLSLEATYDSNGNGNGNAIERNHVDLPRESWQIDRALPSYAHFNC